MDINNLTQQQKVETLQALYHDVASMGREGDTTLAHINPQEAALLKALGGSGTINPNTGLPEYKKAVKSVVKLAVKVAPYVAAAYGGYQMAGGSSLFGSQAIANAGPSMMTSPLITTPKAFIQPTLFGSKLLGNLASQAGSAIMRDPISSAGMLLQGASYVGQRAYQNQQAEALEGMAKQEIEKERVQKRFAEVAARKRHLDILRQQRILTGDIFSKAGQYGVGAGSSAVGGSVASYQSQTTANLVNESMTQGAGSAVSNLNQNIANLTTDYYKAGGRADMFANIGQFGKDLSNKDTWIGSTTNSIFQTFKTA
jgi:hypothetical protein